MMSKKAYIDAVSVMMFLVLTFASLDLVTPTGATEQNGPRMDKLYFKMYSNSDAEWIGLKNGDIDLTDLMLSKTQYDEWLASPSLQAAINIEEEKDLGFFAFYINTNETVEGRQGGIYRQPVNPKPNPTGDPAFRAAVAKLIDKTEIAAEDFLGELQILDVPLAPPFHNDFINSAVIGANYAFKYNGAQAQSDLTAAGYTLSTTPNPYYASLVGKYPWAVPFMRINALTGQLIQDDFDWGGGIQGLTIYSRADKPDMAAAGRRLRDVLRASGIPVNYQEQSRTICLEQVSITFSYHFYTGGWGIGREPDHLHDFLTSEFAGILDYNQVLFNGQGPHFDQYSFTKSTAMETLLDSVKYAVDKAAMIAAAKSVQAKVWGDPVNWDPLVGGMPYIILGNYEPIRTAYEKGWEEIVNVDGVGVGNWFSTFLGFIPSNPSVTSIKMGLSSTIEGLNPLWSWYYPCDFIVLDEIFDTLCSSDQTPCGLAEDWVVGTWNDAGTTKTTVQFTLRSGLKWHPNGAITFPTAEGGDGGSEPANPTGASLTVDDVAFSWLYHQGQCGLAYDSVRYIQEVQTKYGPPTWPMPALQGPGLTATWTGNTTLGTNEVFAKMAVNAYLSLRRIGSVYIVPMFIWKHVLDVFFDHMFDPIERNAVIGSGPWKLNTYEPDVSVLLDANRDYFLTTGSGPVSALIDECAHRQGDAGSSTGSGPGAYDRWVSGWDLAYFAAVFSSTAYTDYPMPNYWRDDRYPNQIRSPPIPPGPLLPFDGTGQESIDGITWGPVIAYPWRVRNQGAGPPYLYVDFNYDHYANSFDFSILGQYWGKQVPISTNQSPNPLLIPASRPPRSR